MSTSGGRYKKLRPFGDRIMEDYLDNGMNISEISKKYSLHYSNLRRFIREEVKERGLEDSFNVQYFNVEDFTYLEVGHTFQFDENMTVWHVRLITEKEGEPVFELHPTNEVAATHWLCGENTPDD